jgi:hypothetical protein
MIRKLFLGTTLGMALGLPLAAETAFAKADDSSALRPVCRVADATRPLKPIWPTVVVENTMGPATERISRRVNYTPAPNAARARQLASYLALLERQPKPVSLFVGVGF